MTESLQTALFSAITSMVTAAPVMFDEPTIMHTFRIVEAASSIIGHLEKYDITDEFLSEFRADWETRKVIMMSEPDDYVTMLDDIATRFVREAKKRNQAPSPNP